MDQMTPREFLNVVVQPNVVDFHGNFHDVRHAFNAVNAVDALAAHLYVWAKVRGLAAVATIRDDSHYRQTLASRNQSFELLRDIAKAQKHVHLTKHNPKIIKASQIDARSIGWGEGGFGEGRFDGVEQVVVNIASDEFAYVEEIVDSSLIFLKTEMSQFGA